MHTTWPRVLLIGLALWVSSIAVTFLTGNANLLPTVVLLGSFLAPVTFMAWAFAHAGSESHGTTDTATVGIGLLARAFLVGGVLGILGSALAEAYLISPSPLLFAVAAVTEEVVKLFALMYVVRGFADRTARTGMLLGAMVGFGFAAFESAGYAMTSMFTVAGLSLRELVETEILRGVLTPVGHSLWTAILGGVLFAATREGAGRWQLNRTVVAGCLGVSLLHAAWSAMSGIAIYVTAVLTNAPTRKPLLAQGYLTPPSETQLHLYTAVNWLGMLLIASIGLFWLGSMRRRIETEERQRARAEQVRREVDV